MPKLHIASKNNFINIKDKIRIAPIIPCITKYFFIPETDTNINIENFNK